MESCQYKIGKMIFNVQWSTEKDLWKKLAKLEEVFGNQICGACQSDTSFTIRTVDGDDYYEIKCKNPECNCKLSYGQNKKGDTLYAKRKNKAGEILGTDGWHVYVKDS